MHRPARLRAIRAEPQPQCRKKSQPSARGCATAIDCPSAIMFAPVLRYMLSYGAAAAPLVVMLLIIAIPSATCVKEGRFPRPSQHGQSSYLIGESAAAVSVPVAALPSSVPFRGVNTWLSFCGRVNETKLLSMAAAQAEQLLPAGYDIFGLDAGWSACASGDCSSISPNYTHADCCGVGHGMDAHGRPLPKPGLYPSAGAHGELGLKPIIDRVHALGLRFQLRMERGMPIEAVQQKVPILVGQGAADHLGTGHS